MTGLTATQVANAKAAIIQAEADAGNPGYTPSSADIALFANDPANSALILTTALAPATPAIDAATVQADLTALAAEAQANQQSVTTFLATALTYLKPILTAL